MRVLITGITGSGGSFLAEHVARTQPGVEIHGISRWHSTTSAANLSGLRDSEQLTLHECDLTDLSAVARTLQKARPQIIFHLASHANVRASFDNPLASLENNVRGTANLLEGIRLAELDPVVQICSTSEVYGQVDVAEVPIRETAPFRPVSPYAVSKATQDLLGFSYFRGYGMKIVRTRMFAYLNHRRADLFATAFALQIARIERGRASVLRHGNLDSVRTFVDVRDAMEAYWLAATRGRPGEAYNIGGTTTRSVREFLELLISKAKVPIRVELDPALVRPADVTLQIPDCAKFREATAWAPRFGFEESVDHLLEQCRMAVAP